MRILRLALFVFVVGSFSTAWAQPAGKKAKADAKAGPDDAKKAPPEDEPDPTLFDNLEEENPNNPDDAVGMSEPVAEVGKKAPPKPTGYPEKVVDRPITLHRNMVEANFDYYVNASPFRGDGLVGGRYGVSDQIEVGLRYGFGSASSDGYSTGKTLALDAEYLIRPWVAAQLSIPILVDPLAVGVTLGAPMKFSFFNKLAFELGRDLVSFRTNRFVPEIENAQATEALVAADDVGTEPDNGEIHIEAKAIYQARPNIAGELRAALTAPDFSLPSDAPLLFDVGVVYTHEKRLDIGGRLGFQDLNQAGDSFGISLFAGWRYGQ